MASRPRSTGTGSTPAKPARKKAAPGKPAGVAKSPDVKPLAAKPAAAKPAVASPAAAKPAARKAAGRAPAGRRRNAAAAPALRVRMYRQGLGDCFLVTLPRADGTPYRILIDCGVVLGTSEPCAMMTRVVENIRDETGGHVDLLVVTHEHWDHVSGFIQARDLFAPANGNPAGKLSVGQVWMAWTENPADPLANRIRAERAERLARLTAFVGAAHAAGLAPDDLTEGIDNLLGFFGVSALAGAPGNSTKAAMEFARGLSTQIRYVRPSDDPLALPDVPGVRVFALGPPPDEAALRKTDSTTEVYRALSDSGAANAFFAAGLAMLPGMAEHDAAAVAGEIDGNLPFDRGYGRVLEDLSRAGSAGTDGGSGFFERYYSGLSTDPNLPDQGWRRIDNDWMNAGAEFALQLDSATNNTSLVLAFEIEKTGKVLLFAADAQVGNWLSWHGLAWTIDGRTVTGANLLERVGFYKVGHHGSHNATLRQKGLDMMRGDDFIAFLPVDHAMAVKKRWSRMPLPGLVAELNRKSAGRVVRVDEDYQPEPGNGIAETFSRSLTRHKLYYEWEMPLA